MGFSTVGWQLYSGMACFRLTNVGLSNVGMSTVGLLTGGLSTLIWVSIVNCGNVNYVIFKLRLSTVGSQP